MPAINVRNPRSEPRMSSRHSQGPATRHRPAPDARDHRGRATRRAPPEPWHYPRPAGRQHHWLASYYPVHLGEEVIGGAGGPGGLDVGAHADRPIWLRGPGKGDGVVAHADIAWVADCLEVQDSQWCHGTDDGFSVCQPAADELDGRAQPWSCCSSRGTPVRSWPGRPVDRRLV